MILSMERRVHTLLVVLSSRVIRRRQLSTSQKSRCRLITINYRTFSRQRIESIGIRQLTASTIYRLSTRQ